MNPTLGNGKICYIELPAADVERSAEFYRKVFGWRTRQRSKGSTGFDDGVGEVSGTWVTGRAPATPGILIYIMVDSVEATINAVVANGGEIVQPMGRMRRKSRRAFAIPVGMWSGSTSNQPSRQIIRSGEQLWSILPDAARCPGFRTVGRAVASRAAFAPERQELGGPRGAR